MDQIAGHEVLWRAFRDHAARAHCDQFVGDHEREIDIVQNRKHSASGIRMFSRDAKGRDLVRKVEARGRLVEQQVALPAVRPELHQHPRKLDALPLAAGERIVGLLPC